MTHTEIHARIGKTVYLRTGQGRGLEVAVTIREHKEAWGQQRWLVEVNDGVGQEWVEDSSLREHVRPLY